eukprot:TRINITY_DN31736_c0_g1_i2.p1 TRINITY_DN31736_c0_g1~~TRINITY_DN31736_c0_g1_i2.p1  ORF type:complete len:421 (+),score=68.23 TRINITY_DN31736_c0_g1_i2:33-1295(+)
MAAERRCWLRPLARRSDACVATASCVRRSRWKVRRRASCRCAAARPPLTAPSAGFRFRGGSSEDMAWVLEPLRAQGWALLCLNDQEQSLMKALFASSREFFGRPSKYKETFKFYPIPGGYMTPFPGTYEILELRRGLPRCPEELLGQAMAAFALLEKLALRISAEVGRDIGADIAAMPSDASSAMRCIHYDRPLESRGAGDTAKAPSNPPALGAHVRIVSLPGADSALNGLKGTVIEADSSSALVSLAAAPEAVVQARSGARSLRVPLGNLRTILSNTPGMYPAHTDSSLITIAPKSSAAGLEAKDLKTGEWFNVEEAMEPNDCLVFVGDPLDYASGHKYPALMHRPAVCNASCRASQPEEHRISTPFFLYPRADAVLAPQRLPQLVFDDLNGNVNECRDRFPWKKHTCYYTDLVYSEGS